MDESFPFVSLIVPCRNEMALIGRCLDSIVDNDYSRGLMEVLVIDGNSEDETGSIVRSYSQRHPLIKLLDNPKRSPAAAFNIGVCASKGDVVMLISAHSTYPQDYVSNCVRYLMRYKADNVGGRLKIIPREDTTTARAIALALSHAFGSGNAYVKTGTKAPRWTDTVAFGCYRKQTVEKVGFFNEKLAGSSDMDFNMRLREGGGKILLVPEIVINYYADRDLKAFWKHNFSDGVWATYVLKFQSKAWSRRHWIPLVFVSSIIASLTLSAVLPSFRWLLYAVVGSYLFTNLAASLEISKREKNYSYMWALPIAFATRHIAHGLGALWGLVLTVFPGMRWEGRRGEDVNNG